jgi:serine/threonine protein kinase
MGLGKKCNTVYLIDYGLAKRYINSVTREHIPFSEKKSMIGTPRYCSLNSLMGYEQSRRDDLESLGYCLIYMLKGNLPWQGIRGATNEEKNLKVRDMKAKIPLTELCKGLPKEVLQYMHYCRSLTFDEKPSYSELHSLLNKVFIKNTCLNNFKYDWHAMKRKAGEGGKKDSEDSNKAEYDGMVKAPQRNMSRRIEIKKLTLKHNLEAAGRKGAIVEDEEVKMPDKSRTLHRKPDKKRVPLLLKSTNTIKEVKIKSEDKVTVQQNEANNQKKLEVSEHEESLFNFKTVSITERIHDNIDDTIPAERETNGHITLPITKCTKILNAIKNKKFSNDIKKTLIKAIENNEQLNLKKFATGL